MSRALCISSSKPAATSRELRRTTPARARACRSEGAFKPEAVPVRVLEGVSKSLQVSATVAGAVGLLLGSQVDGAFAGPNEVPGSGLEPSPLNLTLKDRVQEIIIESKADLAKVDLSHQDLTGAIYGEVDFKEANFEGSDMR